MIIGCEVIKRLIAQEGSEPLRSMVITRVTVQILGFDELPEIRYPALTEARTNSELMGQLDKI